MSQIDRRTLTTRIYEILLSRMAYREIDVGTHLKAHAVAKELGASRTTARKAIDLLIQDGFVKVDTDRHPVVIGLPEKRHRTEECEPDLANQTEQVFQKIFEKVYRRELRSGQTVNSQQLVKELGVSLITVRQALEWACRERLLERNPRKGWRVITLTADEMRDIYQCRLLLEPLALRKAITHISPETIESLWDDCETAISAGDAITEYDRETIDMRFHRTIVENANSRTLIDVIEPLLGKRLMYFGEYRGRHRRYTFAEEHKEILSAIRDNDESLAIALLRGHLERAHRAHERYLRSGGPE